MAETPAKRREDFIQAMMRKGWTREKVEAFLAIGASAFRRRGWVEGEPLSADELGQRVDTFIGREADRG